MINSQEEAIKRLISMAKTGSQRTPLAPRVTSDPSNPPVGLLWIREDEKKAYLKVDDTTTLMVASATPTGAVGSIAERSISANLIMLNTITSDELATNSVTETELAPKSVDGEAFADFVDAISSVKLYASSPASPTLVLDADFDHTSDLLRVLADGVQRFRVDHTRAAFGQDLAGAAVSIQTASTDYMLRMQGAGGALLAEKANGQRLISVDSSGNLVVSGSITSQSGNSGTTGSLSVNGPLTVDGQANVLEGLSVTGRTDLRADVDIDGQVTFNAEALLPADYSAKLGQAVHLRTLAGTENRVTFEGVTDVNEAELQLGTGGPVLSGSLAFPDRMFIGGARIVTSAVDGLRGNQVAYDTLTGGNGPGVGNIAAETIYGYNIKNGSITSLELSPGAVVRAAIDAGAVGSVELADGSVIDRVVASMGVGKLIAGTFNADEVFMGPSGHIYLGPTFASEILDERIQIDASGIVAYNSFNTPLAEFRPGGFTLRTGVDGARMSFSAASGLELFGQSGARTGYLSPLGQFQLDSLIDGARMSLNSQDGVQFYAGVTKNLAYNPGFIGGAEFELPVASEASNDQRHVYAGEYAVRHRATNKNITAPSYVDVPFKNTVGTGSSVVRTQVNYCANPSAINTATGWLGGSATGQGYGRVAALGFINEWAVYTLASAPGPGSILAPLASTTGALQWALSASVRVSTAQSVTVDILWYDINNVLVRTDVSAPFALKTNVVTQVGSVVTSPSNAATFRLKISASLQNTDKLEVSNVLYERASDIGPYFDGYQTGYQWDGTPGDSTSSLTPVAVLDSQNNLLSIYVWSDVPAWGQIEGRDSTANVSRGLSSAQLITANQWSRIQVQCVGKMDKVRLHYVSSDPSRQTRIVATPVWWSGLQVEADKTVATPFCSGNEPGCRWEGLAGKSASIRDRDTVVTAISPTLGTTVSGAIVGGSLTAASFFAGKIFGTEITGGKLTGSIITGNQINGDQILAGTVNGTAITARTITADRIGTDQLTANEIAATSITGDRMVANTITATQLAARSITADKLQADLILSSRIIAGAAATGARVEMTAATGLQAFRADGTRTVFLNSATGSAFFMGEISTAATYPRIVINPSSTVPDEIRFYQTSANYAFINAEPAPGGTAAVIGRSQRVSGVIGAFGCYPTEAFLATQNTSTSLSAVSVLTDDVNIWAQRQVGFFHRQSNGTIINSSRLNLIRAGGGEATWNSPANNSSLVFGPSYIFCGDNAFLGVDLIAKNVAASSSETIKDQITDDFGFVASNVLRRVKAKKYKLKHELELGRPTKTVIRDRRRKKNADGTDAVDARGFPIDEEVEEEVDLPVSAARNYFGLIAEELRAVVPALVEENPAIPGGLLLRHGDLIGVLWKFANETLAEIDAIKARLDQLEPRLGRQP